MLARHPDVSSQAFALYREVADRDGVVMQKRRIAIFDTRAPAFANSGYAQILRGRLDRKRMFLGGHRRGAIRLSRGGTLGLRHTSQQSLRLLQISRTWSRLPVNKRSLLVAYNTPFAH
jgi:hypothetical protein